MEETIFNFNKQFDFEPEIKNPSALKDFDHIILCGMGGSHLAADIVKAIYPGINIYVHKDYGLPPYDIDFLQRGLLIACSYSGNTEETISFFEEALKNNLNVSVVSTGGFLLDAALGNNIPYIEIPDMGIEPRQSQGLLSLAILKLMGAEDLVLSLSALSLKLNPDLLRGEAGRILSELNDKMPIIYCSNKNLHIAYNWKITFNETAKIPSFYNVFPELNHNEMQGFGEFEEYNKNFHVIFIYDDEDTEEVQKRMQLTQNTYEEYGITTSTLELNFNTREEKVFSAVIISQWLALMFAQDRDVDPSEVPMITEFKEKLSNL
jgi:glucose/mannose-6-phosphate isomerase